MLKYIKHHLSTIEHVDVWPVAAFVLFSAIFLVATWYVLTTGRNRIAHMEALPLSDNEQSR
jgi:hypothetical protein